MTPFPTDLMESRDWLTTTPEPRGEVPQPAVWEPISQTSGRIQLLNTAEGRCVSEGGTSSRTSQKSHSDQTHLVVSRGTAGACRGQQRGLQGRYKTEMNEEAEPGKKAGPEYEAELEEMQPDRTGGQKIQPQQVHVAQFQHL